MAEVSQRRASVTISDVATAAGVSRSTVSRVMNGRATVDADISERVRAAAEKLNYRPSTVARSLSLGRTETVAFVVPELENPMFQHVLAGLTEAASANGYRVLVADTGQNPADEAAIALDARLRCDALALVSPRMPEDQLAALVVQASPTVLVNRDSPSAAAPAVTVNYRAGAAAVLTHLVGLGHRRVVYLSGPTPSASDDRRRAGLEDVAATTPGLELVVVSGGATVGAGYRALDPVLAARATAVVAFNDLVAFGLLAALNQAGVAVPKDISVTGFDDIELAQYSTPTLTTAAVPQHELGRQAWQELHAVIDQHEGRASTSTRFDPRLEIRASTGPVPRSVAAGGLAPVGTSSGDEKAAPTSPTPAESDAGADAPVEQAPQWRHDGEALVLEWRGESLARYETGERLPVVHARRPYLHPVHTLGGTVVTESGPVDHRHHYGASIAVPDVNGTSYWGGRTFVRDVGPTLLQNHGRQESAGARVDSEDHHVLYDAVRWYDEEDVPQVEESRTLSGHLLPGHDAWALSWRTILRADHGALTIGSPATNGRPGAGYGGWFWRLPLEGRSQVLSADGDSEELAHGSRSPWLAFVQRRGTSTVTVLAVQHGKPLPWFVRADEYPGAGPSLAWEDPLTIPAGGTVEIGLTTVMVDRALSHGEAAALAAQAASVR